MKNYAIIPKPVELHPRDGVFEVKSDTAIIADRQNQKNAIMLRDLLTPAMGYMRSVQGDTDLTENIITLKIDPALTDLGEEGYALTVKESVILIAGSTPKGVFYGIQTLRQMLPVEIEPRDVDKVVMLRSQPEASGAAYTHADRESHVPRNPSPVARGGKLAENKWQIPCCEITDYPRFAWRGYMLDEGRHFHGQETVLQTLDLMALQKLNIFHWHLTEDQGWRIEIKRYPKLTEIGAHRPGTAQSFNDLRKKQHDGIPHGGFYTQDEIREIVAYAADRHITVIPEIEVPGHCRAAVAAYPELCCTADASLTVATGPGIYKDIYCAGKESTFEFLENMLDEILALFPSQIIHIGGDEAPKVRWKGCPECQRRIQTEGLKNEHELQTYFVNRIGNYLKSNGRQTMGWNEILGASLDKDAIVQYWVRNKSGVLAALKNGQKVVNSAYLDTYLDHSHSLTPLSRAYHFDPIFNGVDAEAAENILGLEAPLWTEWVPHRARLDYQTYPRLTAFAEVGWTPTSLRDYADFRERLAAFNQRLDILGVAYAPAEDWEPPWYRRLFGIFTIAQPQTKTR